MKTVFYRRTTRHGILMTITNQFGCNKLRLLQNHPQKTVSQRSPFPTPGMLRRADIRDAGVLQEPRLCQHYRWRRVRRLAVWLGMVVLLFGCFDVLWRLVLAERLLRVVLDVQGLRQVSAEVLQVGWFRARVGHLRLGEAADAPQVANVELRYSPVSLLHKIIYEVRIHDARVMLLLTKHNAISVAGLDPGLVVWAAKPASAAPTPWQVGRLTSTGSLAMRSVTGAQTIFEPATWRLTGVWRPTSDVGQAGQRHLNLTFAKPFEFILNGTQATVRPELYVNVTHGDDQTYINGKLEISELTGRVESLSFGAKKASLRVNTGRAKISDLRGSVECDGGWLRGSGASVVALDGLSFRLPWSIGTVADEQNPLPASLDWKRLEIGGVTLRPTAFNWTSMVDRCDLTLNTTVAGSALVMQTRAHIDWRASPYAQVAVEIPEVRFETNDVLVATLLRRTGTNVTFVGTAGGRLTANLRPAQPIEFRGVWQVRDATVESTAQQWQVAGLSGTAFLNGRTPDDWRLEAKEDTRFVSATFGNLRLTNGRCRWVVTPHEVFVEQGGFNWCGGDVQMYAVHVALNNPQAECVLYIDQVDLGQLLTQMKVLRGTGSGSLYGRLPLRLQVGFLRLSDGFLYSLPGQGGRLKLTNTEYLAQVLAQSQVSALVRDRLMAALTDFDFSLFRMDLEPPDVQGEAVLRLRIAGQAHAKAGEPPVELNVNVKGPLEQLFNMGLKLR